MADITNNASRRNPETQPRGELSDLAQSGTSASAGTGVGMSTSAVKGRSPSPPPAPTEPMTPQKITFVGSGQVTQLLAAQIIAKNRILIEAGRGSECVIVSILGSGEGSESLKAIQEKGITVYFPGEPEPLIIKPNEFGCVTHNPEEIVTKSGEQDHVFIATKTYSHNVKLIQEKVDPLRKVVNPEKNDDYPTTVTMAQNGLPCWFLHGIPWADGKHLESVDRGGEMLTAIGPNNIVGCVLNLACHVPSDEEGKPLHGVIHSANPKDKIGLVIGKPDNTISEPLLALQQIFSDATDVPGSGIKCKIPEGTVRKSVLEKLEVSIALGPTILTARTVGDILAIPYLFLVLKLATEINAFAKLFYPEGLRTEEPGKTHDVQMVERLLKSKSHQTSASEDMKSGRRLEWPSMVQSIFDVITIARSGDRFGAGLSPDLYATRALSGFIDRVLKHRDHTGQEPRTEAMKDIERDFVKLINTAERNKGDLSQVDKLLSTSPERVKVKIARPRGSSKNSDEGGVQSDGSSGTPDASMISPHPERPSVMLRPVASAAAGAGAGAGAGSDDITATSSVARLRTGSRAAGGSHDLSDLHVLTEMGKQSGMGGR